MFDNVYSVLSFLDLLAHVPCIDCGVSLGLSREKPTDNHTVVLYYYFILLNDTYIYQKKETYLLFDFACPYAEGAASGQKSAVGGYDSMRRGTSQAIYH